MPDAACRFHPSEARAVCERVVHEVLDSKTWNGEEEAVWTVQISEKVKAGVKGTLPFCLPLEI